MTVAATPVGAGRTPQARSSAAPAGVVLRRTARGAALAGVLWGAVYALYVAGSASGYAAAYPTAAGRERLAVSIGGNAGFTALLGAARRLDTVGGFTAWRTTGVLGLAGPIWALLLATRLTRGEEDAGRWELYLAGPITRRRAAGEALLGLLAAPALVVLVTAVVIALDGQQRPVGFSVPESVFLALALTAPALWFLGCGALAAQLMPRRRQATMLAAGVLGASFLLRLLADSDTGLAWLRRLTPLGWAELQHPLTGSDVPPLIVLLVTAALWLVAAGWLAGRRDSGAGVVRAADTADAHYALLGSPLRFAVRQDRPVALGWLAAAAVTGAVGGLVAESAARASAGNDRFAQALQRLGAHGTGAGAYLGVIFLVIAAQASFAATALAAGIRAEEGGGMLDHLLSRPVDRLRWLLGRVLVASAVLVVIGLCAGLASWLGSLGEHTGIGIADHLQAGLNLVPAPLVVLGLCVCSFGLMPRLTSVLGYVVVGWSFLIELIGSILRLNHWVVDSSLLTHVAPAPAAQPDWVSAGVLVVLGCALTALGAAGFGRRDLLGG